MILLKKILQEKVLYNNEWISLISKDSPVGPYVYSHETRCNGNIVAILPYYRFGLDGWKYGVRYEIVPCWGDKHEKCALTGGVDNGEDPKKSAVRELFEESGIVCKESDFVSLGTCRGTKSTDTTYHLYAIDIQGKSTETPTGEETKTDPEAKMIWTHEVKDIQCPIFNTMYVRLGLF